MDNIKYIISKYKVVLFILLFLILSFIVYKLAFAEDDASNKLEVANITYNIKDAGDEVPLDQTEGQGNDTSNTNKIVRNFDSVTYELDYYLKNKEGYTELMDISSRTVIADVLLPKSLSAIVTKGGLNGAVEPVEVGDYNYYRIAYETQFDIEGDKYKPASKINIVVMNINSTNGYQFLPIIRLRESTDSNYHDVSDASQATNVLNDNDKITVSAIDKIGIRIFGGTKKVSSENEIISTMPVGIMAYIPYDDTKGIVGASVPTTKDFYLSISNAGNIAISNPAVSKYAAGSDYSVEYFNKTHGEDTKVINDIPSEGEPTIENSNTNPYKITLSNLKYDKNNWYTNEQGKPTYYVSKDVFTFDSTKTQHTGIIYTVVAAENSELTSEYDRLTDFEDNYDPIVGDYKTKIDFYDSEQKLGDATPNNEAIYSYGQEFYMKNVINYGNRYGDKLPNGFTNYIKLDPDAIQLIYDDNNYPKISIKTANSVDASNSAEDYNVSISYGVVGWNSSNFHVKEGAPSYCPSTLDGVSSEDLMNLYGGPCIEENDSSIWSDTYYGDDLSPKEVSIIKITVGHEYETALETTTTFKTKIKQNVEKIGQTTQVVSRGETIFNGNKYYLSQFKNSSVSSHSADMKYYKRTYSNEYEPSADETKINNAIQEPYGSQHIAVANIGNTILISPFKTYLSSFEIKDSYKTNETTIYSGVNDPISIKFAPAINIRTNKSRFENIKVSVYLPKELELYLIKGDKKPSSQTATTYSYNDDGEVKTMDCIKYDFEYTSDDLVNNVIPAFTIHAYISLDANTVNNSTNPPTNGLLSRIFAETYGTATIIDDDETEHTFNTIGPKDYYTDSNSLVLINSNNLNRLGKTNVVNIDKSESYEYNMRIVNKTDSAADISLIYIIPYNGDNAGNGSNFKGTVTAAIKGALPEGYSAKYTKDEQSTLLASETNEGNDNNWVDWTNPNTPVPGATAIKIVSNGSIPSNNYFAGKDGITLTIATNGNFEKDKYFNRFFAVQNGVQVCDDETIDPETGTHICTDQTQTRTVTRAYSSNISEVNVYNRKISGYAFEDSNYNDLYDGYNNADAGTKYQYNEETGEWEPVGEDIYKETDYQTEPKIKDVAVDIYKLAADIENNNDKNDLLKIQQLISDEDIHITDKDTTTNENGYYEIDGLEKGNYYLKYTFNCDKYTVIPSNKIYDDTADHSAEDSDAFIVNSGDNKCYAISRIITVDNDNVEEEYVNLGLQVRQVFDVSMKKYITNVKVYSRGNLAQNLNYDNQSKVKVDVKNLKNTSFKVTYGIEIENTKYFPGIIGNVLDMIPAGMTFDPTLEENKGWYEQDGYLYYDKLSSVYLMPGEKVHFNLVLDLTTDTGGTYLNIVAANSLEVVPLGTSFVEIDEDIDEPTSEDDSGTSTEQGTDSDSQNSTSTNEGGED